MARCEIVATFETEGRALDQSPYVLVSEAPSARIFSFVLEDSADYQLPLCEMPTSITTLVVTTTQPVTMRFNGQPDGGVPLAAGGVLVLANVLLDQSPLWRILNNSLQQTRLRGVLLGAG